eukprot:UN30849
MVTTKQDLTNDNDEEELKMKQKTSSGVGTEIQENWNYIETKVLAGRLEDVNKDYENNRLQEIEFNTKKGEISDEKVELIEEHFELQQGYPKVKLKHGEWGVLVDYADGIVKNNMKEGQFYEIGVGKGTKLQ